MSSASGSGILTLFKALGIFLWGFGAQGGEYGKERPPALEDKQHAEVLDLGTLLIHNLSHCVPYM